MYIGCVYLPTDSTLQVFFFDSCYERLKEGILSFKEKRRVVLLGKFNAKVGRSVQIDGVICIFGGIRAILVEIDCFPL